MLDIVVMIKGNRLHLLRILCSVPVCKTSTNKVIWFLLLLSYSNWCHLCFPFVSHCLFVSETPLYFEWMSEYTLFIWWFSTKFIGRNFGSFSFPIACECYVVFYNLLLLFTGNHFCWLFDTNFAYINDVHFQVIIILSFGVHWRRLIHSIHNDATHFISCIVCSAWHSVSQHFASNHFIRRTKWIPRWTHWQRIETAKEIDTGMCSCALNIFSTEKWHRSGNPIFFDSINFFFTRFKFPLIRSPFLFRKIPPNMSNKLAYQTRCCHHDHYQPHQFTQVTTTVLSDFPFEYSQNLNHHHFISAITILRSLSNTICPGAGLPVPGSVYPGRPVHFARIVTI